MMAYDILGQYISTIHVLTIISTDISLAVPLKLCTKLKKI